MYILIQKTREGMLSNYYSWKKELNAVIDSLMIKTSYILLKNKIPWPKNRHKVPKQRKGEFSMS